MPTDLDTGSSSSRPKHVAIIMDGNGRWAKKRGLPRIEGHRRGVGVIRKILQHAQKRGVEILSLYAFSTENWNRPTAEVSLLMRLLRTYAQKERVQLLKDNVQMKVIGDLSRIPDLARQEVLKTVEVTKNNTGIILQLALSYSGRDEILRAVQKLAMQRGKDAAFITAEEFEKYLDTAGQTPPDLVIRTSGELRLSNFMIWQAAYAEFFISPVFWPEFNEAELDRALEDYSKRDRRFGLISSLPKMSAKKA